MAKKIAALFWELFKISLFVIGGGYAIIAVADEVFAKKGWTEEGELVDRLPVFQMVPGLIATHTAVYVGNKIAGALGAAIGVVAVALPSVVIFTFVSMGYDSLPLDNEWLVAAFVGLRAALTGIIAATIVRSAKKLASAFAVVVFALSLCAIALWAVPVWAVLLCAMLVGISSEFVPPRGKKFQSPAWLGLLLFLKYGALCFGGGFVLVPMYMEDFVGEAAPYLQVTDDAWSHRRQRSDVFRLPARGRPRRGRGVRVSSPPRLAPRLRRVSLARALQRKQGREGPSCGSAPRVRRAYGSRAVGVCEDVRGDGRG